MQQMPSTERPCNVYLLKNLLQDCFVTTFLAMTAGKTSDLRHCERSAAISYCNSSTYSILYVTLTFRSFLSEW